MRAGWAAILLIFALAAQLSYAIEEGPPPLPPGDNEIYFHLFDSSTGARIMNGTVAFSLAGEGGEISELSMQIRNGSARVLLDSGKWSVVGDVDDLETQGKDLATYSEITVAGDSNFTLYFIPVASANIQTVDSAGSVVPNAEISISCVKLDEGKVALMNGQQELRTDSNGLLLARYVPTGPCVVSASQDSSVGSTNINLLKGQFVSLKSTLGGSLRKNGWGIELAVVAIALVAIAAYVGWKYFAMGGERRKAAHGEAAAEPSTVPMAHDEKKADEEFFGKIAVTEKMRGVLKTLGEREKKIVRLLVKNGGAMRQAKIYNTLLIPKTSLVRALRSLERKNILKLEPFGKTNSVSLSEWFSK